MRILTMLMALMLGLLTVPGEENSSLAKKNGYVINLDRAEKLEKMTYSSLFSKAGIIVLEDTDESLLGKVDKLEVIIICMYWKKAEVFFCLISKANL